MTIKPNDFYNLFKLRRFDCKSVNASIVYALVLNLCITEEGIKLFYKFATEQVFNDDASLIELQHPSLIARSFLMPINSITDAMYDILVKKEYIPAKNYSNVSNKVKLFLRYQLLMQYINVILKHGLEPKYNEERQPNIKKLVDLHKKAKNTTNENEIQFCVRGATQAILQTWPNFFIDASKDEAYIEYIEENEYLDPKDLLHQKFSGLRSNGSIRENDQYEPPKSIDDFLIPSTWNIQLLIEQILDGTFFYDTAETAKSYAEKIILKKRKNKNKDNDGAYVGSGSGKSRRPKKPRHESEAQHDEVQMVGSNEEAEAKIVESEEEVQIETNISVSQEQPIPRKKPPPRTHQEENTNNNLSMTLRSDSAQINRNELGKEVSFQRNTPEDDSNMQTPTKDTSLVETTFIETMSPTLEKLKTSKTWPKIETKDVEKIINEAKTVLEKMKQINYEEASKHQLENQNKFLVDYSEKIIELLESQND